MTGRSNCYIRKIFFSLLILSGLTVSLYSQDKEIGGIVNVYRQVVAIGPGTDNVTLNSVDSIAVGDTVLLIQMQGVGIVTDQDGYGGTVQTKFGEPGGYEFLIVKAIDIGTKNVIFSTGKLINTYDIKGNVQLIKVPYYNTATVTSTLTSKAWDKNTKTGGVLAMIVARKLKLNASIDVSGKGFLGGHDTLGIGECVDVNFLVNNHDSYPKTWMNAGNKGEGLAIHDQFGVLLAPLHVKGQGINFTSGGGGNGKFSGGGGGSNRGKGGDGGLEIFFGPGACPIPYTGAFGGTTVKSTVISGGIFLGGGGGSSTHELGSTGSSGGNGGGIVIIITDTISGNRNFIKADGITAANASGNAGAGGGGAGGSVMLALQSFSDVSSDSLKLSVKGGNGGINPAGYGAGGGGGGGLAWFSLASIPLKVPVKIDYGLPGPTPLSDGAGEIKYSFGPKLNGFLFNSIISSVTGDPVDSVCSNMLPPKILGTKPVGGTAPYTYLWEKSYDEVSWTPLVNDADPTNYTPTVIETNTVYYRRTVTDSDPILPLDDYSKPVKIIVQPAIMNNIVGTSDTICFSQDPPAFNSAATLQNGNGIYSFFWDVSTKPDSALFGMPVNVNNTESYTPPPGLEITSWYRRTVFSGRCVDSSATAVVKITVLDTISSNTITSLPEEICFGSAFADLTATDAPTLAGGDNTFRFRWESNINGSGWEPAPGINDIAGYDPAELAQRIPYNEYIFRRVVLSGNNDVCVNTSNTVLLKDFPVITNNTVSPLIQTIGYDSIPAALTGSTPLNGDGSYNYAWEMMTVSPVWSSSPGTNNLIDYSPLSLQDTTWYRRIVQSSACKDTSNSIVVNVHNKMSANTIAFGSGAVEDTICSGSDSQIIYGSLQTGGAGPSGGYSYKWFSSATGGVLESEWSEIAGATSIDYPSVALTQEPTFFRRKVFSPAASPTAFTTSNSIKITVLPLIANSITGIDSVCYGDPPLNPFGTSVGGGDGTYLYTWQDSTDATGWKDIGGYIYSATATYQPDILTTESRYRRIVFSGSNNCCIDTSNILNIGIHPLPTGQITNTADTTICGGSIVDIKVLLTGAAPWKATISENGSDLPEATLNTANSFISQSPASTSAVNNFNYLFSKLVDNNGCIATSLTNTKNAIVYQVPVADAGPDASVCGPTVTLSAIPSVGTGTWTYPTAVVASSLNNPSVTVTIDSTFSGINISHWFSWEEINWQCKSKDSVQITFDKRINTIYAGKDTTFFSFVPDIQMTGDPIPLLVGSGNWIVESGSGTPDDPANGSTIMRGLSIGINSFKWRVENGLCENMDIVNINVLDLFIPQGFSPDNDPQDFNNTFSIKGLDLNTMDADLTIMNSAGAIVFSAISINGGGWTEWDGKNSSGHDLPEGTYYYRLKLKSTISPETAPDIRSGFIVLRRKY